VYPLFLSKEQTPYVLLAIKGFVTFLQEGSQRPPIGVGVGVGAGAGTGGVGLFAGIGIGLNLVLLCNAVLPLNIYAPGMLPPPLALVSGTFTIYQLFAPGLLFNNTRFVLAGIGTFKAT
jgi:hypothetical protein